MSNSNNNSHCKVLNMDSSHRVILPKKFRNDRGLTAGDGIILTWNDDAAIVTAYHASRELKCVDCGSAEAHDLEIIDGLHYCEICAKVKRNGEKAKYASSRR